MALQNRMLLDEAIILVLINIMVLIVFIVLLLRRRLSGTEIYRGTSYHRLFIIFIVAWLLTILFVKLPNFFAPVMILGVLLTAFMPATLSMGFCVYFNTIMCMLGGLGTYCFYCYGIMLVLGVWLADYMKENETKNIYLIHALLFVVAFFVPVLFSYLSVFDLTNKSLIYALISAVATTLFIFVAFRPMRQWVKKERHLSYETILDEQNPILQDIKSLVPLEYKHAKTVAFASKLCAKAIGVNENIAEAGGLYYHAFNIQKDGSKDEFLKKMVDRCFPHEIIVIMMEHTFENSKPQSKESAIIHMTDALVTKLEAIKEADFSSEWNYNMLVYQTLNELSSLGVYDESGISMNEFLRIRECLAKEVQLV